jgi:hypothetical protein
LQLTAKERRQIAASLKHLVRQQSTDLYHKQQSHKETIMRRQAMLAQQHLEQLANKRLDQMRTMSYIAREQSMLPSMLPAASELLASLSRQQSTAGPTKPRALRSDSISSSTSSRARACQWQPPERSRLAAAQQLPSVVEQQGSQQLLGHAPSLQSDLQFGSLADLQPAGEISSADAVIDIPNDHFSFLPLAAVAARTDTSWPAGSGAHFGSSAGPRAGAGSWGSSSGNSSRWGGWGHARPMQLTEPLLQQGDMQPYPDMPADAAAEAAVEAGLFEAAVQLQEQQLPMQLSTAQQLQAVAQQHQANARQVLLDRYLSKEVVDSADKLLDVAAAVAAEAAAAQSAPAAATGDGVFVAGTSNGTPLDTRDSLHSHDSVKSSSTDASSEHLQQDHSHHHHQQHQQQQQLGLDKVETSSAAAVQADSRHSCDTTSGDVDTPRKALRGDQTNSCVVAQGVSNSSRADALRQ